MPVIDEFMRAIARKEGFYAGSHTIAKRQNNPGNLRSWGSNQIVGGYAMFPTVDAGWAALRQQIRTNINRCLTMYEFFAGTADLNRAGYVKDPYGPVNREGTSPKSYYGYAPGADSNFPKQYGEFVAGLVNVNVNRPLCLYQWMDDWSARGDNGGIGGSTANTGGGVTSPVASGGNTNTTNNAIGSFDFDTALQEAGVTLQTNVNIPGIGAVPAWQLGLGAIGVMILATSRRSKGRGEG